MRGHGEGALPVGRKKGTRGRTFSMTSNLLLLSTLSDDEVRSVPVHGDLCDFDLGGVDTDWDRGTVDLDYR